MSQDPPDPIEYTLVRIAEALERLADVAEKINEEEVAETLVPESEGGGLGTWNF